MRPAICIVQPRLGTLTETFIDAHYRCLAPPVLRLECDPYPSHSHEGQPLLSFGHPVFHRMFGKLFGLDSNRADRAFQRRIPLRIRDLNLARHLRRNSVGVVLAEYGPTGVTIRRACAAAGIPLVVHFHGYDAYKHSVLDRHRSDYLRLFEDSAFLIAVSKHMKSQLIKLGAPAHKVVFNAYGIDIDTFHDATPEENPPVFLAVGRFVEKKAPQLTIRAFAKLAADNPNATLMMIGDGPLLGACADLSHQLNISDQVVLKGPKSHKEIAREMRRARCFVQHSVTPPSGDTEGTPLAVLEAMASGLPVVATRHGGIPDVVTDDQTGYLVDEGDVDAMAAAMAVFLSSPDTAAKLGSAGRQYAETEHSLEKRIAKLEKILEQVIEDASPAAS